VATLNTKARAPQESVLLEGMREIKQEHDSVIADKIRSFTLSYIDDAWDLVTLVLSCSKKSGTTAGEDLVRTI